MKTICLLRHAKSDWNNPNITDFDRPLNDRGVKNAKRLSDYLATEGFAFDKIYSSSSFRTTQTHDLALRIVGAETETAFLDGLYHCSMDCVINLLRTLNNHDSKVLIINHMPTIQYVFEFLSGQSIDNYPTCTFSTLTFNGDWDQLEANSCNVEVFLPPKQLKD